MKTNAFDQAVGDDVPGWQPRALPSAAVLPGRYCRLEALDPERHFDSLFAAFTAAPDARDWTYLPASPFHDAAEFRERLRRDAASPVARHYAIVDGDSGRAVGSFALMRMDPANGVIEVGYVMFSDSLKQRPAGTEAQFLLMSYVFDQLGYRRLEWKCDALNAPSRRSAARLGYRFEGIFRQAVVYKGRSRDTAWHAIIDSEWPALRAAFVRWLAPDNFDASGRQRSRLACRDPDPLAAG